MCFCNLKPHCSSPWLAYVSDRLFTYLQILSLDAQWIVKSIGNFVLEFLFRKGVNFKTGPLWFDPS